MKSNALFQVGYHNWFLVGFYILLLGVFLFGILRPRRRAEWRSAGVVQGWVIALYAEMYGWPLTMYLLAWVTGRGVWATEHFRGHAWAYLFGWGDTGAIVCDVIGQLLIAAGAVLALVGWRQIYRGSGELVRTGLYRHIRHPQYAGFFLFLIGSIVNWPTLITLVMLPLLLMVYYRLAKAEEADALVQFGDEYRRYRAVTGMFWPKLRI
ncbi:MAG TPA: isoprenylcysteine carboxylmethyltransferase family protein [Verrucomicrobiae bacterium]|nr:isoprenylcysteine carboxylmethyltransferase family protein [Verrucomicrobiae bacterium]